MMAAYQPQQPGTMHPGMPHGHPGMAPTPGQHMGQPMMHGGQPHVTQGGAMMAMQPGANGMSGPVMPVGQHPGAAGAMVGMPGQPGQPGQGMSGQAMAAAGPNARGMNQMTPQQMMQYQQQQLQQMQQQNPQLALQQHQAILQRQRQLAQQAQANGLIGTHPGMQGMTAQQLAQFQQQAHQNMGQGLLPPHLATAQMVLQAQHQQAAAQQNHQAQLAQQMAMQHANSQQSNPGQGAAPNQPPNQAHPPQMRPQSRLANRGEQNQGTPQQQQQPGPQQPNQPQPASQASQQPPPPQQPPQQQQQQQQNQAQPPHPASQGPNQPNQPNAQQAQQPSVAQQAQGATPGQQQMQAPQGQQLAPGQTQAMTAQQQQQQQQMNMQRRMMQQRYLQVQAQQQAQQQSQQSGNFVLRIMLFGSQLSTFNATNGKDIAQWNDFINRHFTPEGRLLHSFDDGNPNSKSKTYEVLRPTIARYFWTYFDSGATSLRLHFENAREIPVAPNRMQVSCPHATLTVSYPTGAKLEMSGSLNVLFAPVSNIIESLEIQQTGTEETISRTEIEKVLNSYSPALSNKTSPKMTKKNLPKGQQKLQQYEGLTIDHFPRVPKGSMGVTSRVQQFLEIGEAMNVMSELMSYANENKLRPEPALEQLVQQYETQALTAGHPNPQMHYAPNGVPMSQRTPSMQNMQMPGPGNFASPSMPNLNLPMQNGMNGSPHITHNPGLQSSIGMQANAHTPSPHQSNMAAPSMIPQHSQQGTNSSVASTNTSPNVNNKRRRSTVKVEEEGANQGGEGNNANRVKPSPRMNKKAKPGG